MKSRATNSILLLTVSCAVSLTVAAPGGAQKGKGGGGTPPLVSRQELNYRQQAVQAAFTTLRYKMAELDQQYKTRVVNEAQYNIQNLKLRIEEQELRLKDAKLRVDDARIRVKESQEQVLKCLEAQTQTQQALIQLQQDLKEMQAAN